MALNIYVIVNNKNRMTKKIVLAGGSQKNPEKSQNFPMCRPPKYIAKKINLSL